MTVGVPIGAKEPRKLPRARKAQLGDLEQLSQCQSRPCSVPHSGFSPSAMWDLAMSWCRKLSYQGKNVGALQQVGRGDETRLREGSWVSLRTEIQYLAVLGSGGDSPQIGRISFISCGISLLSLCVSLSNFRWEYWGATVSADTGISIAKARCRVTSLYCLIQTPLNQDKL